MLIYSGYSWSVKKIISQEILPITSNEKNDENSWTKYILNTVFSLLGNTMTICAGGTCNNLYISTLSAFFSAFGIPLFEYIHYLNFIVFFFIFISLLSLYSVKKSWKYLPFILSVIGSILIVIDMLIYDFDYLTYAGNILLIVGAIWNSKLNKRKFGRKN